MYLSILDHKNTNLHLYMNFFVMHLQKALKRALTENKRLARMYEHLTKVHLEAKEEAVSALSQKNSAQRSFHYYTEVQYKCVPFFYPRHSLVFFLPISGI